MQAVGTPREFTLRGALLGIALALVLGAANAYLGLYGGLTVSASIPAAVVAMAVLGAFGEASALENNVVQTIASAGEAVAAGAIFTFPALIILGGMTRLPYVEVTLLCAVGSLLGSLLVIFLRRPYVVEERLPFPEGRACAEVLRAGEAGREQARPLFWGGLGGALVKAGEGLLDLPAAQFAAAGRIGKAVLAGSMNLSPALFGVGYIVGIRIASLVFLGGALGWWIGIPTLSLYRRTSAALPAAEAAAALWSGDIRYMGVGAMLVGGVVTLWQLAGPIGRALRSSVALARAGRVAARHQPREETDIAPIVVAWGVLLGGVLAFAVCLLLGAGWALSAGLALMLVVVGFFAAAVAGYLTGIVGSSNSPVSGVTVIVLLLVAAALRWLGAPSALGARLSLLAASVICTAAAMAGDSLHDLATGFHLRATPRALETAVTLGALVSALVMAPVLNLLIQAYGIAGTASAKAGALAAPQAFLMAKVVEGVFVGDLPLKTIGAGVLLALALAAGDELLRRRGCSWRIAVMPVALGLYLPLGVSTAIFTGALLGLAGAPEDARPRGLLLAAGLVAGEALAGVFIGVLVTAGLRVPLF